MDSVVGYIWSNCLCIPVICVWNLNKIIWFILDSIRISKFIFQFIDETSEKKLVKMCCFEFHYQVALKLLEKSTVKFNMLMHWFLSIKALHDLKEKQMSLLDSLLTFYIMINISKKLNILLE